MIALAVIIVKPVGEEWYTNSSRETSAGRKKLKQLSLLDSNLFFTVEAFDSCSFFSNCAGVCVLWNQEFCFTLLDLEINSFKFQENDCIYQIPKLVKSRKSYFFTHAECATMSTPCVMGCWTQGGAKVESTRVVTPVS